MQTVTIDILNEHALTLLKDLEVLKIIRVRKEKNEVKQPSPNLVAKYKGAMTRQPIQEVEQQFNDMA
jgi:hypothetical protein